MRILVFLLALANLLFLAYTQGYFGHSDHPDAARVAKQVAPETLRVVGRGEPPAEEKKAPAAPATQTGAPDVNATPAATVEAPKEALACSAWAGLSSSDADRLTALLSEKFSEFRQTRKTQPNEGGTWWVFIPPQTSKAEVDKKAAELKKLGISDFFVIQDNGPNRWAISLGVFSAEAGANGRIAELKAKGVRSARSGARNGRDALQTVEARGPAGQQAAMQTAVAEVITSATAQACP